MHQYVYQPCPPPPPRNFNEFLVGLYSLAHSQPIADFQDAALGLVKSALAFDAAIWGTATTQAAGIEIHTVHLHNKTPETLTAYEEVKHLDSAAAGMFTKPMMTQAFHNATFFAAPDKHAIRDYMARFEQPNFLINTNCNVQTSLLHWVTMYRACPDTHFGQGDVAALHYLTPHLMQALALNRSAHLMRLQLADRALSPYGMAIADFEGVLHAANPQFEDELAHACGLACAVGAQLPAALMAYITGELGTLAWRNCKLHWRVEHGLLFIKLRALQAADALTQREMAVAQLVAQGHSYKEVAKALNRAPSTVRNQIQQVYGKLGVNHIAGLVMALQMAR